MSNSLRHLQDLLRTKSSDMIIRSPLSSVCSHMVQVLHDTYKPHSAGEPMILGLSPTKESCEYLSSFFKRDPLRTVTAIGGSDRSDNILNLRKGADIVVGSPGRIDWLIRNQSLVIRNIDLVLLDKSNILLSSEIVLNLLNQVPRSAQRVLITGSHDPLDPWLKDTMTTITRPGGFIDLTLDIKSSSALVTKHGYSIISQSDSLKQLRFLVDKKTIVYVKSKAEIDVLRDDQLFSSWLLGSENVARFNTAARSVLVVDEPVSCPSATRIIHFGLPKSPDDYMARTLNFVDSLILIRRKEFERFKSMFLRKNSGLTFTATSVPNTTDLSLMFFQDVLRRFKSDESSTELVKMYGTDFLTGLVLMAEERRVFDKKTSPLSGESGFSPVLLFDPFMKKIKSHEVCHRIVASCIGAKHVGRIALSEKGYVVDVVTDRVSELIDSPQLKRKNLHAIFLSKIPRIVDRQKTFIMKRTVRDRKLATQLLTRRKR